MDPADIGQVVRSDIRRQLVLTWKSFGSGGIRTHASEETGALNQRLRPLGHATSAVQGARLI